MKIKKSSMEIVNMLKELKLALVDRGEFENAKIILQLEENYSQKKLKKNAKN